MKPSIADIEARLKQAMKVRAAEPDIFAYKSKTLALRV
jgi:hypothetical protein